MQRIYNFNENATQNSVIHLELILKDLPDVCRTSQKQEYFSVGGSGNCMVAPNRSREKKPLNANEDCVEYELIYHDFTNEYEELQC